jgi:hypothetical protein
VAVFVEEGTVEFKGGRPLFGEWQPVAGEWWRAGDEATPATMG